MLLKYDYSEEHDRLVENLLEDKPREALSEMERRHLELLGELVALEQRQYRNVPIEGRLEHIQHVYFGVLHEMAKSHGGCVELEVPDSGETCMLRYKGKMIVFTGLNEYGSGMNYFVNAIRAAESVSLSVEKERFVMTMSYRLTRKEFAEDLSKEIERVNKEMICLRKKIRGNKSEILL